MQNRDSPIAIIQQGAQYYLPFKISHNGVITSPENVDDVKIKVAGLEKRFSKCELEYSDDMWLFPICQEFSLKLAGIVSCQVSIRCGDNIYPSKTYTILVNASIILDGF